MRRTASSSHCLRYEALLLVRSGVAAIALTVLVVGIAFSAWSMGGRADNAAAQFVDTRAFVEDSGQSLEEALQLPTSMTTDGDSGTIENPLRHDYEQLLVAVASTSDEPFVETVLGSVTFVVLPMLMASVGAWVGLADMRAGMLKVRASRSPVAAIAAGRVGVLLLSAGACVGLTVLGALLGDPLVTASQQVGELLAGLPPGTAPDIGAPLAVQMLFAWGLAAVFGLLGLALTVAARGAWPLVLLVSVLLVVPLLGPLDPRNLMLWAGTQLLRLGGLLEAATPIPVAAGAAVVGLFAWSGLVVFAATAPLLRRSRYA